MTADSCQPVSVSRRIEAPAEELFEVLADPARHPGIDGSGMLKQAGGNSVISGVGDTFTVSMHNAEMGTMRSPTTSWSTGRTAGSAGNRC
jgi:hypothetical protein